VIAVLLAPSNCPNWAAEADAGMGIQYSGGHRNPLVCHATGVNRQQSHHRGRGFCRSCGWPVLFAGPRHGRRQDGLKVLL
jgi:hypothetical protein